MPGGMDASAPTAARVVVIDDDAVVRAALERHLGASGLRVVTAADGRGGITLARLARPDVILLDLELPDMHGFEVLDALRADDALAQTPVVVLTGTDDEETLAEALDRGAQDYVAKPPSWVVLDARLRVAVRLSRLQGELRAANEDLAHLAETDPLTGVANRRHGEALLARPSRGGLTVLKVDVDHFKSVNDRHGHAAGDAALRTVAAAMEAQLRAGDHVVRWGGDEFIAVLAGADPGAAIVVAERLRRAVAEDPDLAAFGGVSVSIGIGHGIDALGALADADAAMYDAKRCGGDAVQVARPVPG